jgi:hypothetical protein
MNAYEKRVLKDQEEKAVLIREELDHLHLRMPELTTALIRANQLINAISGVLECES